VTHADSAARAECDRYRAMASDMGALIPTLKDPEAAEDLLHQRRRRRTHDERSLRRCIFVSAPVRVAPVPRTGWLQRSSVSQRSRLPKRPSPPPVALDDPMQFQGVTALEQPGERLQDAVRSIVKAFEAVVTLEPDGASIRVTRSALTLRAKVPNLNKATLEAIVWHAEQTLAAAQSLTCQ